MSYAVRDQVGTWQRITGGFTAHNVFMGQRQVPPPEPMPLEENEPSPPPAEPTMEDYFSSVTVLPSFLDSATEDELAALGVVEFVEAAAPGGGVRKMGETLGGGAEPVHAWLTEALTLAQLATAKGVAIEQQFGMRIYAGFPVPGRPGDVLQLRNMEDRTNWLALQARADRRVQAGDGGLAASLPPRTADNVNLTGMTYDEVAELLDGLLDWAEELMAHRWALKDAVSAAVAGEDAGALAAVDPTVGWPA